MAANSHATSDTAFRLSMFATTNIKKCIVVVKLMEIKF